MGIGDKIRAWLRALPAVGMVFDWLNATMERRARNQAIVWARFQKAWQQRDYGQAGILLLTYLAFVITNAFPVSTLEFFVTPSGDEAEAVKFAADPRAYILQQIKAAMSDKGVQSWIEFTGGLITTPVLTLLEDFGGQDNPDPHEFSRRFHGIASGLPWAAKSVDSALNAIMGDRAPRLSDSIQTMYWGLGLGFLGWQTLAPLLSSGLQPGLQRYYNKLYRPARFTPGQIQDLFALGKIGAGAFDDFLKEQGWRDSDIAFYRDLSYRQISEGDCWKLYHDGVIDKAEMDRRLRAFGYNSSDFELLYKANPQDDESSVKGYTVTTLKAALKGNLIEEGEFRSIMSQLKYQEREIDLQVALIRAQQTQDARDLTTGQVKELYNARVIGRDEAQNALVGLTYTGAVAAQLVKAWDEEALPKAVRLNKSTILEAFTEGVYTRGQAIAALQSEAGYDALRAELLVHVEEAQIKRQALAGLPKPASLSQLQGFVQYGLITRAELEARPELGRYDAETRALLVNLMYAQLQVAPPVIQVSLSTLADAYVQGLLTRADYLGRLEARGMSADDAELQAQVVEGNNPLVFGGAEAQPVKAPSVASLQLALQRGLIDEQGFRDRLAAQGYSDEAVTIATFNAQYQAPANPKSLTQAQVISLYKSTDITRADATRRLLALGYTAPDVELLIRQVRLAPEDTDAANYFLAGLLSEDGVIVALDAEGFSTDEITDFLDRAAAGEIV